MSLQLIKSATACLVLTTAMTFSAQVQAHGGLALADDVCKLTIGPFTMHFTGYQPDSTQEKEFCEDIPATGRTVVALDYIEEALRPMPTEIRVIRDAAGDGGLTVDEKNLGPITVLYLPPKVYNNGSITFEHNFSQPGKFVGLVTINDGEKEVLSRFPFAVGEPKKTSPALMGGIAAVIGAVAVFFFLRRPRKTGSA